MKKLSFYFLISIIFCSCSKDAEIEAITSSTCNNPIQNLGITELHKNPYYPDVSNENVEYYDWSKLIQGDTLIITKASHSLISLCGTEAAVSYNFKMDKKCLIPLNRTAFFDGELVPDYVFPNNPITELIIQEYIPNQKLVCRVFTNLGVNTTGNTIFETDNIWIDLN